MRADLTAAGLHSGCAAFTRAAIPLTPVGPTDPDQAARMFTPGPMTSGLRICGVTPLGPRELKAATTGDGRTLSTVP
ncbi:unnamed protein product [Spirodela intermedia]|uniref:Uncharacterized protein n=2 Tax=Spirodela intermedia TaxID=51605 RepID=A0A7I8J3R3_SPIIN|nr:unnamed protein product [Spirodela intermedia]CAA6664643.1 unnamed protein product [Spirodela intermedia]CAA7401242.1 unnamed protein product [Spirodela intermedia]